MARRLVTVKRLSPLRAATILGSAMAGLVAGHVIDYRLAVPHPGPRRALLEVTGHGYFPGFTRMAVGLGIAAALGIVLLGWRRGLGRERRTLSSGASMLGLATAQAAGFAILETLERLVSEAPFDRVVGPALGGGILVQLVIGALVGGLLVALERSGEAVARALQRPPHPGPSTRAAVLPPPVLLAPRDPLATPLVIRGPPSPHPG